MQTGDWVVLLEGLCRIQLHGLASRPNQPYDTVNVQQLELHKPRNGSTTISSISSRISGSAGSPMASYSSSSNPAGPASHANHPADSSGSNDMDSSSSSTAAGDANAAAGEGPPSAEIVAELGKDLKSSTRHLLQLLSGQAGMPAARRLLELLDAVPAWRAADVVAAALARSSQVILCCQ